MTRIEQGPEVCKNRTVKEDELYGAVMTAINKLLAGGNNMIKTLEENIHAVIGETTEYQISEINTLLDEKQKELIKLANKGQDYEYLVDEIDEMRDKRQTLLVEDASLSGENERINELIEFIRKNKFRTLEYDDKLVRKIIQNVKVYEDHFVIAFKPGIEMEIWKPEVNSPWLWSRVVGFLLIADYNNILMTIAFINQMVYVILSINLEVLYDYGRND